MKTLTSDTIVTLISDQNVAIEVIAQLLERYCSDEVHSYLKNRANSVKKSIKIIAKREAKSFLES